MAFGFQAGGGEAREVRAIARHLDERELGERLSTLALSSRRGDLAAALNAAYRLMEGAAHHARQIVVFTDMTRPEWERFGAKDLEKNEVREYRFTTPK